MALTSKKYEKLYETTGSGDDKLSSDELTQAETWFDLDASKGMAYHMNHPDFAPIIFQLQQMQDELDYLRSEISTNKDKAGISNSQATAIIANTAKTGITLQEQKDISNTKAEVAGNTGEIKKLDGLITTNTTNVTANTRSIGINNLAAINVGAYPSLGGLAPAGTTQSHGSEIVYDQLKKKYFLNIYYIQDTPGLGGKKGQRVIRTGQIELT